MNRKIVPVLLVLLCIYLDSIFFSRVNLYDIRPDTMLAATVSYAVLCGSMPGAIFGFAGGLLLDVFAGRFVGLSAALYLAAGLAGGFFYKKFYADNVFVPAAAAAAAGFAKDIVLSLVAFLAGARYGYVAILLRYILPSAVVTGAFCALIHIVLKPALRRQIKQQE